MKLILLSGGSGKRLWPLSNEVRSKQFLKMLLNGEGLLESMVQRIWGQLEANLLTDQVFVSTSKAQAELIQSQLGDSVPLIIEPEARDTFPSIALAATFLYSAKGIESDEVITVMPVDPYVESPFFSKIVLLEEIMKESEADLALIGVTPTYPSTKYGYIIPQTDDPAKAYHTVRSFKEKPTEEEARNLLDQQAMWNCGVFSFKLGYMLQLLENKGLPTQYEQLLEIYQQLPKISFDYEVVERAQHVVVVPYDGYWRDLGTWNTLTEEMDVKVVGNGVVADDCLNTHVINELGLPVAVIGASDLIVAASPDGILVSNKAKSHLVKTIAQEIDQRPMFEERRWGWYHVLNYQKFHQKEEMLTKRLHIHAGKNLSYQFHRHRSEVWVVVAGEGEFILDDQPLAVSAGDVLSIPVGAKHTIKANKDLDIIEVQLGTSLVEHDIVRISMSWDDIKKSLEDKELGGRA